MNHITVTVRHSESFGPATLLINKHPVMDKADLNVDDQIAVGEYLIRDGHASFGHLILAMPFDEFEDFLVNFCGDD